MRRVLLAVVEVLVALARLIPGDARRRRPSHEARTDRPARLVAGPNVRVRRRVSALSALALSATFACTDIAVGAESARGLHLVDTGNVWPYAMVLSPDGTPWFTGSDDATHVTADGRVIRYHLPIKGDVATIAWGADGALWMRDDVIGGFSRMTPDGRVTRYRDLWATQETLGDTNPPASIIAGADGTVLFGDRDRHRITSIASDGSLRVVARVDPSVGPELLATGGDGSVWFVSLSDSAELLNGLGRVLPDGRVEALRYRTSEFPDAAVAPNGDVWFIRLTRAADEVSVKRTDLVRIDPRGHVARFRAPTMQVSSITVGPDGTVWISGNGVARMDGTGRFTRIRWAPGWENAETLAAPDGRLWLILGGEPDRAAWLPKNPCLSRRLVTLHLHSRRRDPIRSVTLAVQGRPTRRLRGRNPTVPIDLRSYLPGAVRVSLRVHTAHRRYTRQRVYHTCTPSGGTASTR